MLKNFLFRDIQQSLNFDLTSDQQKTLEFFSEFYFNPKKNIFIINGYAGTGKTTLIKCIVQILRRYQSQYVLLAPTGRAAKVLATYCNDSAFTIHKYIYRQKSITDFRFVLNHEVPKNTIFFIDEASLISNEWSENNVFGTGKLLDDLLTYVFKYPTNKIVFIGDAAQLPPVGSNFPPALNESTFSFNFNVMYSELKEVVRQHSSSIILINATNLREKILSSETILSSFKYSQKDFVYVNSSEILEYISDSYNSIGIEDTIILTYSNKRALKINQIIRSQILFYDEEITAGERLMVVKNNYMPLPKEWMFNFIANGEMIRVCRILKEKHLYDFRFLHAVVELSSMPNEKLDVILFLDTLHSESPSLTKEEQEKLFLNVMEDYQDESSKKKKIQKVKENIYFNALQIKYAYAITTHKAQGGQWKNVFIDASFLNYTELSLEVLKWFYTSITRATEKVFVFGLPEKYR